MRREDKYLLGLMYVLGAPIVVYSESYSDLPKWITDRVIVERFVNLFKAQCDISKVKECTDIEALAYLMTASLATPLAEKWIRIYYHLCSKYVDVAGIAVPELKKPLTEYELRELKRLKRWILKKQLKALKQRQTTITEFLY